MSGCPGSHQHWQAEAGFLLTPPGPRLPFSFGPGSSSCVTAALPSLSHPDSPTGLRAPGPGSARPHGLPAPLSTLTTHRLTLAWIPIRI